MKIYKLNESDWVAAENLDDAKRALSETVSNGQVGEVFEEEFIDNPYEVADEDLDKLRFTDDDNLENIRTFREELNARIERGEKFPQHFASSEY